MQINGIELDFRLYDEDQAERKKRYFDELKQMQNIEDELLVGTEQEKNRYLCDRIKRFFDNVFGEGTGVAVCGERNDLLNHLEAFDQLVEEQVSQNTRFKKSLSKMRDLKDRMKA